MPARKSTSKREGAKSASKAVPEERDEEVEPAAAAPAKRAAAGTHDLDPERRPRLALAAGGVLLVLGLALVGGGPSDFGKFIALGALLLLIYGVHSFGRLGPA
jgi:hypothetical protein